MSAHDQHGDTPAERLLNSARDLVLNERMPNCEFAYRCRQRLCPVCSGASVRRAMRAYVDLIDSQDECLSAWFSIEDVGDFGLAWSRLNAVARGWAERMRGQPNVEAFVFSIEVNDNNPNWHIHGHAVIFGNDLQNAAKVASESWIQAAADLGISANRSGVGFRFAYSPRRALSYVLKGKLGHGGKSLRETLAEAVRGDADALDRFHTVEKFLADHPGIRWRFSWRRPAPRRPPARTPRKTRSTYDYSSSSDMRLMMLADLLGVVSKAGQASLLTNGWDEKKQDFRRLSSTTIARIRRHPTYEKWRSMAVAGTHPNE